MFSFYGHRLHICWIGQAAGIYNQGVTHDSLHVRNGSTDNGIG